MTVNNLPTNSLKPDPNQPRQSFDSEMITALAQSYKTEGVINPIEVDRNNVIITGEQRWRAAIEAGLETVPCIIRENTPTPYERLRRQVIENEHRDGLNDYERACAIKRLVGTRSRREVARELGVSSTFIDNMLRLLEEPKNVRDAVKDGLPYTYTIPLRKLKNTPIKTKLLNKAKQGKFAGREQLGAVVDAIEQNPKQAEEIVKQDYEGDTYRQVRDKLIPYAPHVSDVVRHERQKSRTVEKGAHSIISYVHATERFPKHAERALIELYAVLKDRFGAKVIEK